MTVCPTWTHFPLLYILLSDQETELYGLNRCLFGLKLEKIMGDWQEKDCKEVRKMGYLFPLLLSDGLL